MPQAVLDLPIAVFGPLSSGSDVRLLARPEGLHLSADVLSEIERFYYACWRANATPEAECVAGFRATPDWWVIARTAFGSTGGSGRVVLGRFALLDTAALTAIGGRTHLLWDVAFPNPLAHPTPNSVLPLQRVEVDLSPPVPNAGWDAVAYELAPSGSKIDEPAILVVGDRTSATAEAYLYAALERLGSWAAGRSYCSRIIVEAMGFPGKHGAFDISVGQSVPPGMARREVHVGGEHPPAPLSWLQKRELQTGLACLPDTRLYVEDLHALAEVWLEADSPRLAASDFGAFGDRIRNNPRWAAATLSMLELFVAKHATKDSNIAAAAIDAFVATALKLMPFAPTERSPDALLARLIVQYRLAARLSISTITALARPLLGETANLDALASQPVPQDEPRLAAWLAAIPANEHHHGLVDRLLAVSWHRARPVAVLWLNRRFANFTFRSQMLDDGLRVAEHLEDRATRRDFLRSLVRILSHLRPQTNPVDRYHTNFRLLAFTEQNLGGRA